MAHEHTHEHEHEHEWIGILLGCLLFAAAAAAACFGLPFPLPLLLYLAAYLVLGGEVLLEALHGLFHAEIFDENFLMALATIGALAIGEYPEAVGVMIFFRIGEYCEHLASARSRRAVMEAVDLRPETVLRLQNGAAETIPAAEAQVGDLIEVRPGDRIPLDGTVQNGQSRLDTSPVTGESVPVAVAAGQSVVSGCINLDGVLTVRVEKVLEDSMVTRILRSVESAAAGKPRVDRFITRFSRVYTPAVVAAAVLTAVIPPLFFHGEWLHWIYTALTFLVISCPCALVLSVPLAFFSGIGAGSRRGILFKDGAAIEALAAVRAVVMDKTGTLTEGRFAVRSCEPFQGSEESLLAICAAAESSSTHPVGVSIVAEAALRSLPLTAPAQVSEIAGQGIRAVIGGDTVLCGNRRLMTQNGIACPELSPADGTEVLVAVNGTYRGRIIVADAPKADAAAAVREIQKAGLHTAMLTGDIENSALPVAKALGVEETHAALLPDGKLDALRQIRTAHGAVLFVGDGINDTPVLAGADVGAAMGSGSDAAIEAADVVFMTDHVTAIPTARRIARRAVGTARGNIVLALAVKAAVLILGLCGFANMWLSVFADTGVALLCVLNSVTVLYRQY